MQATAPDTTRADDGIVVTPLWMPSGRPLRHLRWGTPDDCGAAVMTGRHETQVRVLRVAADGPGIKVTAGDLGGNGCLADLVRSRALATDALKPGPGAAQDVLGLPWSHLVQSNTRRGWSPGGWRRGEAPTSSDEDRAIAAMVATEGAMVVDRIGRDAIDFLAKQDKLDAEGLTTFGGGHETRRRRMQAVALYPYLIQALPGMPEVVEAIDAGRPFEPLLAARHGIRPSTLRRTRGVERLPHGFEVTARIAEEMPPEWIPATMRGWEDFGPPAKLAAALSGKMGGSTRCLLSTRHKGDWGALGERLANAFGPVRRTHLDTILGQVEHTVSHAAHTLVQPMLARVGADHAGSTAALGSTRIAFGLLFKGRSITAVVDVMRRHHKAAQVIEAELPRGRMPAAWAACFATQRLKDGIHVVPLTTPAQLRDEGFRGVASDGVEGLDHCVGTMSPECARGRSHILSIRQVDGDTFRRLATADVTFVDGALKLNELSGASNEPAPRSAASAMETLSRRVAAGDLRLSAEAKAHAEGVGKELWWDEHGLRYDPGDDACMGAAWEIWRPLLTRRHAAMDLGEVLDEVATLFGCEAVHDAPRLA